jgi:hypothetical protein
MGVVPEISTAAGIACDAAYGGRMGTQVPRCKRNRRATHWALRDRNWNPLRTPTDRGSRLSASKAFQAHLSHNFSSRFFMLVARKASSLAN